MTAGRTSTRGGSRVDYYDKILVGIAASLLGGVVLGIMTPIAFNVELVAGTLVATLFVYAGTFRNPPLPETDPQVKVAAVAWHAVLLVETIAFSLA